MPKKKILAISGSTRKDSSNYHLIEAIRELYPEKFDFRVYGGIAALPHFNPDQTEETGEQVIHFREMIQESDAVMICTPEYAHGVPGSLKNAIDWTVATGEFSGKPVMLITASSDGKYGHAAMLEILRVIEAKYLDALQLLISFVKTKVSRGNKITDAQTLVNIRAILENLDGILSEKINEYK